MIAKRKRGGEKALAEDVGFPLFHFEHLGFHVGSPVGVVANRRGLGTLAVADQKVLGFFRLEDVGFRLKNGHDSS
jgi:hypothetical protein